MKRLDALCQRIKKRHLKTEQRRLAKLVLGPSIIKVFNKDTKGPVEECLCRIQVAELTAVYSARRFGAWYQKHVIRVGAAILRKNKVNPKIRPGVTWGHAAKILSLFLREVANNPDLLPEGTRRRIREFLFVPVDRKVIGVLSASGVSLAVTGIKDISSKATFDKIQSVIGTATKRARIPRIWFDDVWADPSLVKK